MSILCQSVPNCNCPKSACPYCVRVYPTVTALSLHVHTVSECAAPTASLHVHTVSECTQLCQNVPNCVRVYCTNTKSACPYCVRVYCTNTKSACPYCVRMYCTNTKSACPYCVRVYPTAPAPSLHVHTVSECTQQHQHQVCMSILCQNVPNCVRMYPAQLPACVDVQVGHSSHGLTVCRSVWRRALCRNRSSCPASSLAQ